MHDNLQSSLVELQSQMDGELRIDAVARTVYSTDASLYQETPLAVAIPTTEADIRRLILFAGEHKIGLIPRAAGTSLAGQVVGAGIVVDISRHFTKILEIDADAGWARVQPGVIRNELNMALRPHGVLFGPETSTQNRAMLGGMFGNNSCGSNSIVYGSTREHVLEVRGFLSDGSEATFTALSDEEFQAKCAPENDSLESQIYRGIRDLLSQAEVREEIQREFPKPQIPRRNTGYAVDLLMDAAPLAPADAASDKPFDFCKLLAGSEGTLFFATEIKVRCMPLPPPASALLCPHFETVDESLRATLLAVKHSIFACELVDHFVLSGAARNIEQRANMSFVDGTPGAILAIEFRAETDEQAVAAADKLVAEMKAAGLGYHFPILTGDDTNKVWDLRKAGLGILSNVVGDAKPLAVIEDTAVAIEDLPEFIAEFNRRLKTKHGLECVHYAHAGSGEIHLRPIINLKTDAGNQQFRDVAQEIADLVKEYRGSLSGEHGDGRLRGEFLQQMIGPKNYEVIRQVKRLWDPQNIFNPNKIVDTPPMNSSLRYKPGQATPEVPTVLDFSGVEGVLRAAELCNGAGDCRKTQLSGGTMCPSYMATRNEQDTTRARANMLRHVLTAADGKRFPFDSEEVREVMDLCLSCKGCKRECPSNVDVAKLKAEFQQGYYDAHGVPRRAKLIANFARNSQLAAYAPWMFNFIVRNRVTSRIFKRFAGFAPKRSLPTMHRTTLSRWFATHTPHPSAGQNGRVLFFCDEFTNYNDTPVGIAAIELLERLGFAVEIPEHRESGRAALSKGLLRQARDVAEENVRLLKDRVSADLPLVGVEPSALLSFRDEYPELVRGELRDAAAKMSEHCLMIDEFLAQQMDAGRIKSDAFRDDKRTIRLHGHCHQKALASLAPTVRMLQLPRNYTVRLIPSGCCGMAGSFGYETEHYDLSMQIGELVLFPTVRKEPEENQIAAPGTSCRHQIADGTGRKAEHPVQILRDALLSN
ncbi:FAD-binding and (Fe-S)-binding domain-containing protein [Rosistilla oblonga]|uniref:Anaerobic glycerol-3-phosphate dehydrogenase subunit C n=1 Tax=Rosistilla oblonga TaxID=2527990 RepID=A0A518IXQ0_9BACT|nr:FAD-binding and (Fe-S)-binding domain-containing protein [Rosistilla oblonga]QDV57865.1 Anaerobic glycerol-3-phosphate dehydrogenase subunit C [Rosistilla oblonga]